MKQERSTSRALSDAQHKHGLAVADEHKAASDLSVRIVIVVTLAQAVLTTCKPFALLSLLQVCQKHLEEAQRTIESRRTELEKAQRRKNSGDVST